MNTQTQQPLQPRTYRAMGRSLVFAMLVVVLAFLLSAVLTQVGISQIRDEVVGIQRNAMPSVEELVKARSEFMRMAMLIHRRMPAEDIEGVIQRRQAAEATLSRYASLPMYPGEHEIYADVREQVRALDARIEAFQAKERAKAGSVHAEDFRANQAALERVDSALVTLILFNTRHLATHAVAIEGTWRRSMYGALVLGGFCVLLSLGATVAAVRAIRGYARLLERRATELEEFAGRVAHDVLSPLTNVGFVIPMLRDRRIGEERAGELAARGISSLTRVETLVDGLLEFARAGARPTPGARAGVRQVIEGVVADLREQAEKTKITLSVNPLPDVEVACSPGVLTSMLSNLARNAIKHMGQRELRWVTFSVTVRKHRIRFEVSDTGPGLALEVHRSVFEPYVRGPNAAEKGIGLGLATVKRLADSHGGRVGVRSAPGEGAHFWFELPLGPAPPLSELVLKRRERWLRAPNESGGL